MIKEKGCTLRDPWVIRSELSFWWLYILGHIQTRFQNLFKDEYIEYLIINLMEKEKATLL